MSYLSIFNDRNTSTGNTLRDIRISDTRLTISNTFADNPSYFEVHINDSSPCLYGVQIVDDSKVRDQKEIVSLDYQLQNGDIIEWQSSKWINILTDNMSDIYYRGTLRRCVGQLKWLDSDGEINSCYFTFKTDPATNFGVNEGQILTIGKERRSLILSLDSNSQSISKDKRFIFSKRAWKVTAIDDISIPNLLFLTVEEDEIIPDDDTILSIANYNSLSKNYTIQISNPISQLTNGQNYQIHASLYDGITLVNKLLVFTSSNKSIASVDQDGLVNTLINGIVDITVSYGDVIQTITIRVENAIADNKYVVFENSDFNLYQSESKTYQVHFENNGVAYDDTSTFSLFADDGLSTTTLASITTQDSALNTCKVKAGSKLGYVKLKVQNGDGTVIGDQRVRIKSIL